MGGSVCMWGLVYIYMDGSKYMWGLVYMWMGLNMCEVWCIYMNGSKYVWGLVYVCGWVSVFMFGVSSESAMYLTDQLWQIISK